MTLREFRTAMHAHNRSNRQTGTQDSKKLPHQHAASKKQKEETCCFSFGVKSNVHSTFGTPLVHALKCAWPKQPLTYLAPTTTSSVIVLFPPLHVFSPPRSGKHTSTSLKLKFEYVHVHIKPSTNTHTHTYNTVQAHPLRAFLTLEPFITSC